jgi:hypothetical protein
MPHGKHGVKLRRRYTFIARPLRVQYAVFTLAAHDEITEAQAIPASVSE